MKLSARQTQVLELVAAGQPMKVIAGRLGIAIQTGECHARAAREKLGARTKAHAVAIAMRLGLLK